MRPTTQTGLLAVILASAASCGGGGGGGGGGSASPVQPLTGWALVRSQAAPVIALPGEFGPARVQPIATDGWEDGIAISRDGLHLMATYAPADLLSFTLAGADQMQSANYLRGPTMGMDLTTNPAGATTWIQADLIHATRASVADAFGPWQMSAMKQHTFSEGAPVMQGWNGTGWGLFVYTTNQNPPYKTDIMLARNVAADPAYGGGVLLPAPVTASTQEDNPHIERLSATDLVLFFDSDDRVGGLGSHDIWYCTSADDGATWTVPAVVATVSTAAKEHQPHLFFTGGTWWLYYSATNPLDGKLGIYRARQSVAGNWDSWIGQELVVGAGNTAGVGEPTLTSAGDLSFVVVYEDTAHGTATNRYDADPWFAPRVPAGIAGVGGAANPGPCAWRRAVAPTLGLRRR